MLRSLTRPYNQIAQTLESDSFDAHARKHGMNRDQALEFVIPYYLAKLHELREHLNELWNPPEERIALLDLVEKLIAQLHGDPTSALEVVHRTGLQHFDNAIEVLKAY